WPSSVSLYFVSKLAARHVKVVLTGEGSDELFGGYARYNFYRINRRWGQIYGLLPETFRRFVRGRIAHTDLLSGSVRRKLQHSFLGRGDSIEELYLDNFYGALSRSEQLRLLTSPALVSGTYDSFLRYWNERPSLTPLSRMLYADQKTYLVELLMKQDQMSMACSIESRVPFLDHPFVEFAVSVPDHLKIRNGVGKCILKRAVEGLLPRQIIYRKKMGFPTPLSAWLRDPRADGLLTLLRDPDGLLASYLNLTEWEALLDRHRAGLEDATDRIWRLLNLQIWGDLFLTGRREQCWEGLLANGAAASAL